MSTRVYDMVESRFIDEPVWERSQAYTHEAMAHTQLALQMVVGAETLEPVCSMPPELMRISVAEFIASQL